MGCGLSSQISLLTTHYPILLIMSTYIISGATFEGYIKISYNISGLMESITNETNLPDHEAILMKIGKLPMEEQYIPQFRAKGSKVIKAPEDLSFERFWNEYGYKVGNKKRAEKIWSIMSETERSMCIASIKNYNQWLSQRSVEKLYPETYLSQKRYQNEFTGTPTLFKM